MSQIIPHLNILLQMILLQYIVSVMSQIIPHLNLFNVGEEVPAELFQ